MVTMCLDLMGCDVCEFCLIWVVDFIIIAIGSAKITMELLPIFLIFIVALIGLTYLKYLKGK